jgi:hypothetical protein
MAYILVRVQEGHWRPSKGSPNRKERIMMMTAEQLVMGDYIQLSSYGERAVQPEYEDVYYVDFIDWYPAGYVVLYLLETYSNDIAVLPCKLSEKVEVI